MIGFFITVYVALAARSIREEVLRRARLPEILGAMEALGKSFSEELATQSDPAERVKLLGQVRGLLNSPTAYSDKDGRAVIAVVIDRVVACQGQSPRLDDMLALYYEYYNLIEVVRDWVRRG